MTTMPGRRDRPPAVHAFTVADYERARRILMRRDPVLRALIVRHGRCGLGDGQRDHGLRALIEAIVWQQLSGKAAATIFARFLALFPGDPFPAPEAVLQVPVTALRGVGLSGQKASYVRDICDRVCRGVLDPDGLDRLADEEVVQTLTQVKGIGRWSAEMFLMFRLRRPDVLPVGDLGIAKAIQRAYRLRTPPTAKKMLALGRRWEPYRSVASWYLWQSQDAVAPGDR